MVKALQAAAPIIAIIFVVLTWASAFVAIRYDVHYFTPGALAFIRYLIASVIMLLAVIASGRYDIRPIMNPKGVLIVLVSAASGISLYNIAVNYGEQHVNAGLASFIVAQGPIFAILLSVLCLKERLRFINVVGLVIATAGMLIIFLGGHSETVSQLWGIIAVCLAALLMGGFTVIQKPLVRRVNPIMAMSLTIWVGTLSLTFYAPAAFRQIRQVPLEADIIMIYLGIVPAALAYVCWSYALSHLEVKQVTPAIYAIPLATSLISVICLGEAPTVMTWIGGSIALVGSYLAARRS
ncbi:MAG: EamA family transporter [Gammaproteobacteria bacterium]|nr:EamA family transporter [Gammaproteobacteria bacterium]